MAHSTLPRGCGFPRECTLEPLQTLTVLGKYPEYGDDIKKQVDGNKKPIEDFLELATEFELALGRSARPGRTHGIARKLKWRFVESKAVDGFRKKDEGHILLLNNSLHRLLR